MSLCRHHSFPNARWRRLHPRRSANAGGEFFFFSSPMGWWSFLEATQHQEGEGAGSEA